MKTLSFAALCVLITSSAFSSNLICPEANSLSFDKIMELKSKGSITIAASEHEDPDNKQEIKPILMLVKASKNVDQILSPAKNLYDSSVTLVESSTRYDSNRIICTYKYRGEKGEHSFEIIGTKH